MTRFDHIYKEIVDAILTNGMKQSGQVRTVYADGEPAYTQYLYGVNFAIHPEDGLPILQSKRVAWKTAFRELDWIWRLMSNDVRLLQEQNCHIWDEWQKEDGTIGSAYGARLAHPTLRTLHREDGSRYQEKVNQVAYIINQIKFNPASRRIDNDDSL
ncbi:thymidylate synthase [Hutsoniella sourekii]